MTSPDDGLEDVLRRALSEAAHEVEPSSEGLDRIRAQIGGRSPRPWLVSVLAGLVDRARHWTWRGHWAWQESRPRLPAVRERRSRRSNFPEWDTRWLRLVTVAAGAAVIVGASLGVQPVRHALLETSTSLSGGGATRGSAGPEGNGTQTGGGDTPAAGGASSSGGQSGPAGTNLSPRRSRTPALHGISSARCVAAATPPASTSVKLTPASVAPTASGTAVTAGAIPATQVLPPLTQPSATPTSQATHTSTNAATCPVTPPTKTPAPATPTAGGASSSWIPAPSVVTPTRSSSPTQTAPSRSRTPTTSTATPGTTSTWASPRASKRASTRASAGPRPGPSSSPAPSGRGRQGTRPAGSRRGHPRQR